MNRAPADRLALGRRASKLTEATREAMVRAAERALLPRFGSLSDSEREQKSPGEIVTIADRECEAMLSEALARLLPEASIVGEEASHEDRDSLRHLSDGLCWIIDPLDGTGYFADGRAPFGIMVALAAGGAVVGGWILDPLTGRFCSATAGGGCWIDGRQLRAAPGQRPAELGLSALLKRRPERLAAVEARVAGHFALHDIPRCAAAHYPAMLLAAPSLTYFERTLPWDHAPGVLMIEEAGGVAQRLDGSGYRVDEDRTGLLVATSPALWEQAAALLQDLPE